VPQQEIETEKLLDDFIHMRDRPLSVVGVAMGRVGILESAHPPAQLVTSGLSVGVRRSDACPGEDKQEAESHEEDSVR